ncbi:hypothetical protein [Actinoplanes sp. NPDC049802]|uniref:hypothetical protein n=1 Tax=Actinoplanes sp. NPDC049802 TaxID=3154742 RepID=UPI0033EA13AC
MPGQPQPVRLTSGKAQDRTTGLLRGCGPEGPVRQVRRDADLRTRDGQRLRG